MVNDGTRLIHPFDLEVLREKLEKLNRRGARLGCKPAKLEVLGEETVERSQVMPGGKLIKYEVTYNRVRVTGDTPKLAGWSLVAAIEYLGDERLVRCVPGESCPEEFRTRGIECDHCGTERRRREVFVLRHEDGTHKQVGRSCIADFLGGVSPEQLLAQASWGFSIAEAANEAEEGWGGCYAEAVIDVEEYLCGVAICIRRLGWMSKSAAGWSENSTSADAWQLLRPSCKTEEDRRAHTRWVEKHNLHYQDRDLEMARNALQWACSQPTAGVSDYLYNLGVACRVGYVTYKTSGIVASVIQAYLKQREREEEINRRKRETKTRGHVGTPTKREVFGPLTVKKMRYIEGFYGTTTLVIFEDGLGNLIKWFASREVDEIEQGDVLTVKATVKEHGEYNGVPETVVQRLVVEEKLEVAA